MWHFMITYLDTNGETRIYLHPDGRKTKKGVKGDLNRLKSQILNFLESTKQKFIKVDVIFKEEGNAAT